MTDSSSITSAQDPISLQNGNPVFGWRAWHVFVYTFEEQDEYLREVIAPVIESLQPVDDEGPKWFFIRYWENGFHLRLRLRNLDENRFSEVGYKLLRGREGIIRTPSHPPPATVENTSDHWHDQPAQHPIYPAGTVAEVAYQPETRRYGGIDCIRGCEAVFEQSSLLALNSIGAEDGSGKGRRGLGLLLSAIGAALATSDEEELIDFLAGVRATWSRYLGPLLSEPRGPVTRIANAARIADRILALALAARTGQAPENPIAAEWVRILNLEKARLADLHDKGLLQCPMAGTITHSDDEFRRAIVSVFSSHTHMMMNRLGITPRMEYEFAGLLGEALADR